MPAQVMQRIAFVWLCLSGVAFTRRAKKLDEATTSRGETIQTASVEEGQSNAEEGQTVTPVKALAALLAFSSPASTSAFAPGLRPATANSRRDPARFSQGSLRANSKEDDGPDLPRPWPFGFYNSQVPLQEEIIVNDDDGRDLPYPSLGLESKSRIASWFARLSNLPIPLSKSSENPSQETMQEEDLASLLNPVDLNTELYDESFFLAAGFVEKSPLDGGDVTDMSSSIEAVFQETLEQIEANKEASRRSQSAELASLAKLADLKAFLYDKSMATGIVKNWLSGGGTLAGISSYLEAVRKGTLKQRAEKNKIPRKALLVDKRSLDGDGVAGVSSSIEAIRKVTLKRTVEEKNAPRLADLASLANLADLKTMLYDRRLVAGIVKKRLSGDGDVTGISSSIEAVTKETLKRITEKKKAARKALRADLASLVNLADLKTMLYDRSLVAGIVEKRLLGGGGVAGISSSIEAVKKETLKRIKKNKNASRRAQVANLASLANLADLQTMLNDKSLVAGVLKKQRLLDGGNAAGVSSSIQAVRKKTRKRTAESKKASAKAQEAAIKEAARKDLRIVKHLKYSAAAHLAYVSYIDPSSISTPTALLGSENAKLVDRFELQQVRGVRRRPNLAEDIKELVNEALPGSQVEVTPAGTLIDASTGLYVMLVQDTRKPRKLILTFGGTSAGARNMVSFDDRILQRQWKANVVQGVGGVPESTLQAVLIGGTVVDWLAKSGMDIVCAGHSKGGMEAIVVGLSLGKRVYADNPAPVVGARSLIRATAEERGLCSTLQSEDCLHNLLEDAKQLVHTVSISIDPVSHLMGPTREEFGVHDEIRMVGTDLSLAHNNVVASVAGWITRNQKKPEAKNLKEEGLEALTEERQLQQEVRGAVGAVNVDVLNALQWEKVRDSTVNMLRRDRVTSETSAARDSTKNESSVVTSPDQLSEVGGEVTSRWRGRFSDSRDTKPPKKGEQKRPDPLLLDTELPELEEEEEQAGPLLFRLWKWVRWQRENDSEEISQKE